MGEIIDGKAIAAKVTDEVATRAARLAEATGVTPGLSVVLIGDDVPSGIYVRRKERAARRAGIVSRVHRLSADTTQAALVGLIEALNADPTCHGILVQLPLPQHLHEQTAISAIHPSKDVDGFHQLNAGHLVTDRAGLAPCTPRGVMRIFQELGVELRGAHAVVVGRSRVVGRPMAAMLLAADATVSIIHRHSRQGPELASMGDVLVVAVGKAGLVDHRWIKPGAVVIDVGINRMDDGRLTGDVVFEEAMEIASAVTPVPGGVGPMTIAMLLENTCEAAERLTGFSAEP